MSLIPSRGQWKRWSLPSRLTAFGALVGVVSLLLFLGDKFFGDLFSQGKYNVKQTMIDSPGGLQVAGDLMVDQSGGEKQIRSIEVALSLEVWPVTPPKIGASPLGFQGAVLLVQDQSVGTLGENQQMENRCEAIGSVRIEPVGSDRVKKYGSYALAPGSPLRGASLDALRRIRGVVFNHSRFIAKYRAQGSGKTVKIELSMLVNGKPFLKWDKVTSLDAHGLTGPNGTLIKLSNEIAQALDDQDSERSP